MTKQEAIKKHCFQCAGDSNKEVTLCHLFDCPLWPFRTGQGVYSSAYKARMDAAFKNYEAELKEIEGMGLDLANFRPARAGSKSQGKRKTPVPQSLKMELDGKSSIRIVAFTEKRHIHKGGATGKAISRNRERRRDDGRDKENTSPALVAASRAETGGEEISALRIPSRRSAVTDNND